MISSIGEVVRAEPLMCAYAFDVLCGELRVGGSSTGPPRPLVGLPDADDVGVFVTWNAATHSGNWRLRGCIGTLTPTKLRSALRTYAQQSAFHDKRFDPIVAEEVPRLQAVVSVLSGFEPARDGVYDWTVGTHGIVLNIRPGQGRRSSYSATFLPEVCEDQGWTKEECIETLARKAGFRGPLTPSVLETAELTRYVSTKAKMSYHEYVEATTVLN
jgi:AMME syndrome candidate gene 1 protein